jgi:hypothetical protein
VSSIQGDYTLDFGKLLEQGLDFLLRDTLGERMSVVCRGGCTARTVEMPNISYGSYTLLSDSALRTL